MNEIHLAIVVARFNEEITQALLTGTLRHLQCKELTEDQITTVWVPGAFEIPLVAKTLAASGHYDAIICLGAVIKGDTYHFEVVANQTAAGIMQASLETGIPIIMGVLTTYTEEQALERVDGRNGLNRGEEAAATALAMIQVDTQLQVLGDKELSNNKLKDAASVKVPKLKKTPVIYQ